MEEIQEKAQECLNCKNPMCRKGCPIATNIPGFIKCIKEENLEEAYKILKENNIMSEICSIVCESENQCMGSCVKGIKGKPVSINKLENYVNNWAKQNHIKNEFPVVQENNKKIAIIGAGPAGISCAVELRKKGYKVTIFEKEEKIGGLLEYGIPDFRLPKTTVNNVFEELQNLKIEIKTGIEFGKDINLESLKNDGYNAVFLGIGAYISNQYKLTDNECEGIYTASEILSKYYKHESVENLDQTIVIGGGNVAIDSARVLKKMGIDSVKIVYRRNNELMPAIKADVESAIKEGVEIVYNTKVVGVEKNKFNKIEKIKCIKTEIKDNKVLDIENSNFEIPANTVVFAIGLGIDENLFEKLGIETENGLVKVDDDNMTTVKGVFAGGDLITKKPTVCKAIATGKTAAIGIEKYLN